MKPPRAITRDKNGKSISKASKKSINVFHILRRMQTQSTGMSLKKTILPDTLIFLHAFSELFHNGRIKQLQKINFFDFVPEHNIDYIEFPKNANLVDPTGEQSSDLYTFHNVYGVDHNALNIRLVYYRMKSLLLNSLLNDDEKLYIIVFTDHTIQLNDKTTINYIDDNFKPISDYKFHLDSDHTIVDKNFMKSISDNRYGFNPKAITEVLSSFNQLKIGNYTISLNPPEIIDDDVERLLNYDLISSFYTTADISSKTTYIILNKTTNASYTGNNNQILTNLFKAITSKKLIITPLYDYIDFIRNKTYNNTNYDWLKYEAQAAYDKSNHIEHSVYGGGIKQKYKIHINKKTNFIYILINKKKIYLYKDVNNKFFITLNDKKKFINKKNISSEGSSNFFITF